MSSISSNGSEKEYDFHRQESWSTTSSRILFVGREEGYGLDLDQSVELTEDVRFDFLSVPLVNSDGRRDGEDRDITVPFTKSNTSLSTTTFRFLMGRISPWLNLESEMARNSENILSQEISWAGHVGYSQLLLPPPSRSPNNYARAIHHALNSLSSIKLLVPLDACETKTCISWPIWNKIRLLCEEHSLLKVALLVNEDVPTLEEQQRWAAEPIELVIIPSNIFLTNRKGFPVLSARHQQFIVRLMKLRPRMLIRGEGSIASEVPCMKYLRHLHERISNLSKQESYEEPYLDYLQVPLQPLMDNLHSQTYEIFEQDPVKYVKYREAIEAALSQNSHGESTVVMVVGAGRGPLVNCVLQASKNAAKKVTVYAIEKNPNAVAILRQMKEQYWHNRVTIVSCDMRDWSAPEKADIIISELLGSFGDNELSPECLDGAQQFLRKGGISIPQQYNSYLAPVSTTKLWHSLGSDLSSKETPYVVKLHNFCQLAESKKCFTFSHPSADTSSRGRNERQKSLKFEITSDSLVHGFVGYFDTKLFGDVMLSINPQTFSTGMFSWFPMLFPLRSPLQISAGSTLEIHFWRRVNEEDGKVWFEWCVTSPVITPIHNSGGRSSWIGL